MIFFKLAFSHEKTIKIKGSRDEQCIKKQWKITANFVPNAETNAHRQQQVETIPRIAQIIAEQDGPQTMRPLLLPNVFRWYTSTCDLNPQRTLIT